MPIDLHMGITSALTQEELGNRLQEARERANLSREEAASALGISRERLRRVEDGEEEISAVEILDVADLYDVRARDLIQGEDPESDLLAIFRTDQVMMRENVRAKTHEIYAVCRVIQELRGLLGRERRFSSPYDRPPSPGTRREARAQGRSLALRERERLSLGRSPIRDLHTQILDQGIGVGRCDLPDNVSGLYLAKKGALPFILLNTSESGERRRFSLAHEYCHALVDVREGVRVSRRDDDDLIEARANAFAGNFLLPREAIRTFSEDRGKDPSELTFIDVADLSYEYNVSYEAALVRLKIGGFLTQSEFDEFSEKSRQAAGYMANNFPVKPPTSWNISLRQWAFSLVLDAFEETAISSGRALEIADQLDIPRDKVRDSLDAVAGEGASVR